MQRVLVTGARGFIGSYVCPLLEARGYTLYPVTHAIDLTVPSQIDSLFTTIQPDLLLHLAWETQHGHFWHSTSNLNWLQGSLYLLQRFVEHGGKRVVIAGTSAEIHAESSLYGTCKDALRKTATAYLASQHVSFAWGRIFTPFGPPEKPQRLIPALISSLLQDKLFICNSSTHIRDFLYVSDVADALVTLLTSSVEGLVDIGSSDSCTLATVVTHVAQKLNKTKLVTLNASLHTIQNPLSLVPNLTRLNNELQWHPKETFETGIAKTINWWQNALHH